MNRYWMAKTKEGKTVSEKETKWADVKDDIQALSLIYSGKSLKLPENMPKYIQAKTASSDLSGENVEILSRYVGFELGNNTVVARVNEETDEVSIELMPKDVF